MLLLTGGDPFEGGALTGPPAPVSLLFMSKRLRFCEV